MSRKQEKTIASIKKAVQRADDISDVTTIEPSILLDFDNEQLYFIFSNYTRGLSYGRIKALYDTQFENPISTRRIGKVVDELISEANTYNESVINVRNHLLQSTYASLLENANSSTGMMQQINERIKKELTDNPDIPLRDLALALATVRDTQVKMLEMELKMLDLQIKRESLGMDNQTTNVTLDFGGFIQKDDEA